MSIRQATADTGLGVSCLLSAVIHLAVFLLLMWWGELFPGKMPQQETYYVDIVNLPVASPQAGDPQQKGNETIAAPAVPPPPDKSMTSPTPRSAKTRPTAPQSKTAKDPGDSAFEERMARLSGKVEAGRQEDVMERLKNKVRSSGSGRAGMPLATGLEAGSDYASYIQSRLKDAFRTTISYSSNNPEMIVRLFIDGSGRLTRWKPERSSGDRGFDFAVQRAIDIASEKFPPTPDKKAFEGVFVFKPQGITPERGR